MPWIHMCFSQIQISCKFLKKEERKHIWARLKIRHPGNMLERFVLKLKPKAGVSVRSHTGVFEGPTNTLQLIHSPKICETSFGLREMNVALPWVVWLAAGGWDLTHRLSSGVWFFTKISQGICWGGTTHLVKFFMKNRHPQNKRSESRENKGPSTGPQLLSIVLIRAAHFYTCLPRFEVVFVENQGSLNL